MVLIVHRVQLAHMRDATMRLRAAHRLARTCLTFSGSISPQCWDPKARSIPWLPTDQQQIVYQHARHLGLAVDSISPMERRQQTVRAAKEQLRQR